MNSLLSISLRQWALYASLFVVGLAVNVIGLLSNNAHDEYKRFFIVGFAIFFALLFFIFFLALQKKWKMPVALYAPFIISHAALAALGFGVIPVMLFERSLLGKDFFLFAPTGVLVLVMASAAAFFCYWVVTGILAWLCRTQPGMILTRARDGIKKNSALIVCIGALLLFLYVLIAVILGPAADFLFLFGLLITPFMMYTFSLFTDQRYIIFSSVLTLLYLGAQAFLMVKSAKYGEAKKEPLFFDSVAVLSRHFFIAHLVAWAVYMKILGIVFQFGSWNPF